MPYEQKPNEGALFPNDRNPSKSDLTGQITIPCPHCGASTGYWMNAWRRTSQKGLDFISLVLKAKQEPTAHQTFRRDDQ